MASRKVTKLPRAANSPSSSTTTTTSSSKRFPEASLDCQTSPATSSPTPPTKLHHSDPQGSKENVTVTVRFRPLSQREIRQGEEVAWYADGESIVRNEHNPSIAYAYDRVFGPTTTTRQVYDIAAQHAVNGAMEGINGTIFAYGVTSSGKTHTMHGNQRSPGIIPLAIKDVFSIIQETPNTEFLLRLSYLEIYNEVVNDLLNPAGQNLKIREDSQGTFVEGIKEEVVLSPAHALSLIAAGEEHRHVGSTNFNLQSSRSHTIFTLTIESSPCGDNCEGEAVKLSQLNLIDLAGSESSKAETTGVRRKEGSYINKSLLTLGTVISKLTDGRATHIPYRDSKLTRLLQSSLSGHGRVSLICTVTPSSSSSEETHNTLKFAHRAKHIEIQAAQNKIIDEKSLIKKYQNEIRCLKEELEQLKRGIIVVPQLKEAGLDNIFTVKQKLEDGQVRLQSRLDQEEDAKAALLGRIQRLTKLILVSSKASQSSRYAQRSSLRRRHSFGEEELAYLPHRRRDLISDDEIIDSDVPLEGHYETAEGTFKEERKSRKPGLLSWLKPRRRENGGTTASFSDKSSGFKSVSTPSTPQADSINIHAESRLSHSLVTDCSPSGDLFAEGRHDTDTHEDMLLGQDTPLDCVKTIDQFDFLREQQNILSGEMVLNFSALKHVSDEASKDPTNGQNYEQKKRFNDDIGRNNEQIGVLQMKNANSFSPDKMDNGEISQPMSDLLAELNEKSLEVEVMAADNRIMQEQLNQKILECEELQREVVSLKLELKEVRELKSEAMVSNKEKPLPEDSKEVMLIQEQAFNIEQLNQKIEELSLLKDNLEVRNQKLAEESCYAKGLASAAAVELKALSEEVAKLMNQNERLASELNSLKNSPSPAPRRNSIGGRPGRRDPPSPAAKRYDPGPSPSELKRELAVSRERELAHESALQEREQREAELLWKMEESKQREEYLENELANMWVLVAKLKKSSSGETDSHDHGRDTEATKRRSAMIEGYVVE
uniref:Kinesin-like protein n=1 Tax=Kalanchoe fedtschenkoi TaxID=63787 RepID=A0A7N1A4A7_KALFE